MTSSAAGKAGTGEGVDALLVIGSIRLFDLGLKRVKAFRGTCEHPRTESIRLTTGFFQENTPQTHACPSVSRGGDPTP
jgi:hypothetical protein